MREWSAAEIATWKRYTAPRPTISPEATIAPRGQCTYCDNRRRKNAEAQRHRQNPKHAT